MNNAIFNNNKSKVGFDCYEKKLSFLSQKENWSGNHQEVEVIPTHMSVIFLTEHFAYKMKRPILYLPMDYRSLESRKVACLEELRLNQALAASVYKSLVILYADKTGNLTFDKNIHEVEYLVKMRRLNEADTLRSAIIFDQWRSRPIKMAATKLAKFYQRQAAAAISLEAYIEKLRQNIQDNVNFFSSTPINFLDTSTVTKTASYLNNFIDDNLQVFRERYQSGQIVEGHGDLRAEHVFLEEEPVFIDRIEFQAIYRYVDILEDLALLSVDCELLSCQQAADIFLEVYKEVCNYPYPEILWHFFRSHRALTWSRLAAWHIAETEAELRQQWLLKTKKRLEIAYREAGKVISGAMSYKH